MKVKVIKPKKKKHIVRYVVFGGVFFAFLIYAVYMIGTINSEKAVRQSQLDALNNEIIEQNEQNSELEAVLNYSDEEYLIYVNKKARQDLDYVKQGERVFINSSGD